MTRAIAGTMPGRATAVFLCNFCAACEYVAPDDAPDRWIGLGRDVHLCGSCAKERRCAIGLMDKLAALPPSLLDVVVQIADNMLRNEANAIRDQHHR